MRISGKLVADEIKENLKLEIAKLKKKGITPKIAIITLGPEGAWETYVRQKIKTAAELGIDAVFIPLADAGQEKLLDKIIQINSDSSFHGMIVQRPMPGGIDKQTVTNAIAPEKDVDGFQVNSKFEVPVWLAAKKLIAESFKQLGITKPWKDLAFVVVGKGETAGGPAIKGLKKLGVEASVVDSKTKNPNEILKKADIIITSAGKKEIINAQNIKSGVVLIGVGTHVEDEKLRGDYNGEDVEEIAASYTPTPGGVGPVNLAYLFSNLIEAAKNQTT